MFKYGRFHFSHTAYRNNNVKISRTCSRGLASGCCQHLCRHEIDLKEEHLHYVKISKQAFAIDHPQLPEDFYEKTKHVN